MLGLLPSSPAAAARSMAPAPSPRTVTLRPPRVSVVPLAPLAVAWPAVPDAAGGKVPSRESSAAGSRRMPREVPAQSSIMPLRASAFR